MGSDHRRLDAPCTYIDVLEAYPHWNADRSRESGKHSWHRVEDAATGSVALIGGCDVTTLPNNVTHILSVINFQRGQQPLCSTATQQQLVLDLADHYEADLDAVLPRALAFLDDAAATGGLCYCHCEAGRSRSASVLIAWLMRRRVRANLTPSLLQCWATVARKRRIGALNYGFLCRLNDFERALFLGRVDRSSGGRPRHVLCGQG